MVRVRGRKVCLTFFVTYAKADLVEMFAERGGEEYILILFIH